jgi:DNA polymerase I
MPPKVLLVDAYAAIYRAFYAIRSLTGPGGEPVNAIYGFTQMLWKLLAGHRPTHCAVVFDRGEPRHRLAILPSYKQQRPPTPPELNKQLSGIREIIAAMRVAIVEIDGEEADDIIATFARLSADAGADVLIASHDKDFMQLVEPRIRLIRSNGQKTALIDEAGVESRYGVKPVQVVDFLSLVGDSVDNIRGVPGVGEKTATGLLREYHSIQNLLASLESIKQPKLREAIRASADRLSANRQLISLHSDLALPATLDDLRLAAPDYARLSELLAHSGFKSLLARVREEMAGSQDLFERS